MCSGKVLASVYSTIYDKQIDPRQITDRIEIQKAVYLLNGVGVSFGDYNFIWYKHGPYSLLLDQETMRVSNEDIKNSADVLFNERAQKAFQEIRAIMTKPEATAYTSTDWAETLASIHYIHSYMSPGIDKSEVLRTLLSLKPNLLDEAANSIAYDRVSSLAIVIN